MKKNLLAITACFMACLLLAGCGAARNETGSSQPSETLTGAETTAASETTGTVEALAGYSQGDIGIGGAVAVNVGKAKKRSLRLPHPADTQYISSI